MTTVATIRVIHLFLWLVLIFPFWGSATAETHHLDTGRTATFDNGFTYAGQDFVPGRRLRPFARHSAPTVTTERASPNSEACAYDIATHLPGDTCAGGYKYDEASDPRLPEQLVGGLTRFTRLRAKVTEPNAAKGTAQNIALGLERHLDDFAGSVGGSSWKQWARGDPAKWKSAFMDVVSNPSNKVKFNLTGVDDPWRAATRAASGRGGATDWELLQIKSNPGWWDRLTFFENGKIVPNPFQ